MEPFALAPPASPRRIRLARARGWRKPANTVSVARPSKWGNPFRIDARHDAAEQVRAFARWLARAPAGIALARAARKELAGKSLACWCRLEQPCHADILLAVANPPRGRGEA
jgi:hypothetical protein